MRVEPVKDPSKVIEESSGCNDLVDDPRNVVLLRDKSC